MERFAASTVFSTNMAMVMGPTPPGTGVIAEALSLPPVKWHCSVLAEDAIKSAIKDYNDKQ